MCDPAGGGFGLAGGIGRVASPRLAGRRWANVVDERRVIVYRRRRGAVGVHSGQGGAILERFEVRPRPAALHARDPTRRPRWPSREQVQEHARNMAQPLVSAGERRHISGLSDEPGDMKRACRRRLLRRGAR